MQHGALHLIGHRKLTRLWHAGQLIKLFMNEPVGTTHYRERERDNPINICIYIYTHTYIHSM